MKPDSKHTHEGNMIGPIIGFSIVAMVGIVVWAVTGSSAAIFFAIIFGSCAVILLAVWVATRCLGAQVTGWRGGLFASIFGSSVGAILAAATPGGEEIWEVSAAGGAIGAAVWAMGRRVNPEDGWSRILIPAIIFGGVAGAVMAAVIGDPVGEPEWWRSTAGGALLGLVLRVMTMSTGD